MLNRGCGGIAAWPINWNPKKWCKISSIHSMYWTRVAGQTGERDTGDSGYKANEAVPSIEEAISSVVSGVLTNTIPALLP